MAQRGVTRSGEAYCLHCKSSVDQTIERCPSCDSVFREEVKAFFCPRCESLLTLGTPECSGCGMKFKVMPVKLRDSIPGLEMPLSEDAPPAEQSGKEETVDVEPVAAADSLSEEQVSQINELLGDVAVLVESREKLLVRMSARLSDEKERLATLADVDTSGPRLDIFEQEVVALADDMTSFMNLYLEMTPIADRISALAESLGFSEETRQKGLAAKAMRVMAETRSDGDSAEIRAKEDQLAKREEMVNRKIKGYAQKKKELDDREAELADRLERIQREQDLLQQVKTGEVASDSESVRQKQMAEFEREIARRLARMEASLKGEQPSEEEEGGEAALDERMSSLESHIRTAREEREEAGLRLRDLGEQEDEARRLLRALDQLLGQLPESAIQQFTQSEDYKLYERVLDRLKI